MTVLNDIITRAKGRVKYDMELSEEKIWSKHGTTIWKAPRFIGTSLFYPIYKYQDYYSYSPLSLILLKGGFRLNHPAKRKLPKVTGAEYYSGNDTMDYEITRIGGPLKPSFVIKDPDEYVRRIAAAMCKDIDSIETAHPGYTNIILCGGKDSLNLSLLPWKNAVVVASAPPNYSLVKSFLTDNGLPFDIIRLRDDDRSLLECEILVNCCRNDLEHCRWGPHLRKLSQAYDGKVIFWKGQGSDAFLSTEWIDQTYKYPSHGKILEICRPFKGNGKYRLRQFLNNTRITQRLLFRMLWYRKAMWQGVHMSILRELTDSLVLSGYNGPAVQDVVSQVDWKSVVTEDLRPRVGEYLHGSPVFYPITNPAPPLSDIRKNISHLEPFLETLGVADIPVLAN